MNQGLIPRRYAKALLALAAEKGADSAVYESMGRLAEAFNAEPDLQKAMANPHVCAADKAKLISSAARPDAKSEPLIADLTQLMERNRRTEYLRSTAIAYLGLFREARKIFRVKITSAAPLEEKGLQRIQTLVNNHLPAGATAEFTATVDPALIGGFTVSIDNELLDASVANDLKQLRLKLLSH